MSIREETITQQEIEKASPIRLALEEHTADGEALLGSVRGELPGITPKPHYIGLTARRLIFLPVKRGEADGEPLSIRRQLVNSIRWRGGLRPKLRISLLEDDLDIGMRGPKRRQLGREMTDAWDGLLDDEVGEPAGEFDVEERLAQARDLQALGLINSARDILQSGRRQEVGFQVSVKQVRLEATLAESLMAMRAAGAFLFADVALQLLLVILVIIASATTRQPAGRPNLEAEQVARILISLWLGVGLWRGQSDRRGWAILWAIATLFLIGLSSFLSGDILGFLVQTVYSGALMLVLIGRSGRGRTLVAIAIYVVGYILLPAVLLLGAVL